MLCGMPDDSRERQAHTELWNVVPICCKNDLVVSDFSTELLPMGRTICSRIPVYSIARFASHVSLLLVYYLTKYRRPDNGLFLIAVAEGHKILSRAYTRARIRFYSIYYYLLFNRLNRKHWQQHQNMSDLQGWSVFPHALPQDAPGNIGNGLMVAEYGALETSKARAGNHCKNCAILVTMPPVNESK